MGDELTVPVGIGELRVSRDPGAVLVAYGLGSCVGVCLYDPGARVGGLAHVMLPGRVEPLGQERCGKFADCAVPMLLEEMARLGGNPRRLVGKIAGGAHMLTAPGFAGTFNVGERNVEAVRVILQRHRVPLLSAQTGGNRGRTLAIHVGSGRVMVRIAGERETEL